MVGRDSIVDIATRYGMDGPRIESPVSAKNLQTGPGAHQPPAYAMGTGSVPRG